MKTAFDRDLFDKRWDWDEIGKQLDDFFRSMKPDPEIGNHPKQAVRLGMKKSHAGYS